VEATPRTPRRRVLSIIITACLGIAGVAGLTQGLRGCSRSAESEAGRPLNGAELHKLAGMRVHNYTDGRAGLSGEIATPDGTFAFAGWVDWQRALIYLATSNPRSSGSKVLIQAMPGMVAYRSGPLPATDASPAPDPALPPPTPPADNWRVRPFGVLIDDKPDPIDGLIGLIFSVAAKQADRVDLLQLTESSWLRADTYLDTPVEVLMGPAVIPTQPWTTPTPSAPAGTLTGTATPATSPGTATPAAAPSSRVERTTVPKTSPSASTSPSPSASPPNPNSLAAHGGAVAYWIDGDGLLRRMEALLTKDISVRVDLQRNERPDLHAAAIIGGARNSPRTVTPAEAKALARMRQRDLHAAGARVTLSMPVSGGRLVTGTGWLDWREGLAYLLTSEVDDKAQGVLFHAGPDGIANRAVKNATKAPIPVPRGGWTTTHWSELGMVSPITDMDILFNEALSLASPRRDDTKAFAAARFLRADTAQGTPVAVFEIPGPSDAASPAGYARLRYWVDATGVVHRIEIRTRFGGFGWLDIDTSRKPPALPASV
jgi:hypothetical protein